jgi:hypothetical protein
MTKREDEMTEKEARRLLPMTVITLIDNPMKITGIVTEIRQDRFYVIWINGLKETIRFVDAKNIKIY